MSGSSSGGGPTISRERDCEGFSEITTIASPVEEVIETLSEGDMLSLRLEGERGPVLVITAGGETAGSILGAFLADLVRCMNEGHEYSAEVRSIEDTDCSIQINHVDA